MTRVSSLTAMLWLLMPAGTLHAHTQSTSLIRVESTERAAGEGRLQVDVALLDLEQAIGLDRDGDGAITWGELHAKETEVIQWIADGARLSNASAAAEPCELRPSALLVDEHADGAYAVVSFTAPCLRDARGLTLDYSLLFSQNASHRALVSWSVDGAVVATSVLSDEARATTWHAGAAGFWSGFGGWVAQGVWHIGSGYDHLLFLATLLLPAVVRRRGGSWQPQSSLGAALRDVVKVVTAFTLAHSASLLAGALGWLRPESRWVESGIALTVLLGALNLLFPLVHRRLWVVALGFGLIHGLGFASTLAGLGLAGRHLVRDLLGFNLGVELGQLVVIAAFVPLAFSLRHRTWYRVGFTPIAAGAIAVVASVWLYQRAAV